MIEDERRGELAEFGESGRNRFAMIALHDATLGTYTHRVKKNKENLAAVDRERRVLYQLNFLDSLAEAGTPPEVSYSSDRVQSSISQLNSLMPQVPERMIRDHAARTLEQLQGISNDSGLQANCARVLASLQEPRNEQAIVAEKRKKPSAGVAALISTAHPESVR